MVERIKTLTAMQLKNRKNRKAKTKSGTSISIIVQVALCILIIVALYFVLNYVKGLAILPIDENFFIFLLFITQAISVIGGVLG